MLFSVSPRPRRALGCAAFLVLLGAQPAKAESAPGDCTGIDFDRDKPIVVSRIVSKAANAFYVKSAWEDAACPYETAACRRKAYLVPGDLVLTGRQNGPFTCIAYQSPIAKKPVWTNGWMRNEHLSPVAPSRAHRLADWTGTWVHAMGEITIAEGKNGKLSVDGIHAYKGAQNVHTGILSAEAAPTGDMLAFADDGERPFAEAKDAECQVRMQRVGKLLVVEDNGGCGGVMVTFTGFYRRK
jgi:hypothetical protein